MTALVSIIVLLLHLGFGAEAGAQEQRATGPVVSLFAGGASAAAIWTVDIDATGIASVKVTGGRPARRPTRQLSDTERARLRSLVEALPTDKRRYHFGEGPIDAAMSFGLVVGTGNEARRYSLVEGLDAEDLAHPEVEHILNLLHFLHGLVGSPSALPPPQLKGQESPK